jgi:polar amino acid transport system substrate-binding protein
MSLFILGCQKETNDSKSLTEKSTLNSVIKSKKLRVCTDPGYEPFEMRNKNNDIIGFDIDLAREMAKAMNSNVELEIVPAAFDGIIPALLTEKCDMILAGMTISPERNIQVNFPQSYLLIGQTILLSKNLEGVVNSYKDLDDPKYVISGRLGVTGTAVAEEMMPKAQKRVFEAENEAILEVVNGQADAFVYDFPLCASYAADYPDKLVFLSEPFTYEPLGIAIRKGDPDFINWIDNFLNQIKGDGRYDELYNYWFNSNEWKQAVR